MQRNFRFGLLLNTREKTALEQLALIEGGLSQADLIRRLIHQAAREKGLYQEKPVSAQIQAQSNSGGR